VQGAIHHRLLALAPRVYVERLLGQPVGRSGKVRCPFHTDRTPSLHVYQEPSRGWYCYGCHRGGSVYDLAALLLSDRSGDPQPDARTAAAAYGPYDEEILEQALPVYASWVAASFMVAIARRPDAPALERQLKFL